MQRTPDSSAQPVPVQIERMVAGGLGLGREQSGRILLVQGALPGERVLVQITETSRTLAKGQVQKILEPVDGRRNEPCPEVAAGCGGCDLQHAEPSLQLQLKAEIVSDALRRIAKLEDVPVSFVEELPATEYRTTLRCGVDEHSDPTGLIGFRKPQSHLIHPVSRCMVAHPLIQELLHHGRFEGASEVTFRVGARTSERLAVVDGLSESNSHEFGLPEDVRVVTQHELDQGAQVWIYEQVAGQQFRISARSFFQARPDGAEALIKAVARALGTFDPTTDRLVDLYGGVGLFTAGLRAERAILVERSESSASDALVNLKDLNTQVIAKSVERWMPSRAEVVVADPARAGLSASGVAAIVATEAERVALVSCDPASQARDLGLLVAAGYEVCGVELVDMFPQTHHIEAVSTLRRVSQQRVD
ncbi:MAG: TRAM domain-containing protein [Microthrixaceae bacterium]